MQTLIKSENKFESKYILKYRYYIQFKFTLKYEY